MQINPTAKSGQDIATVAHSGPDPDRAGSTVPWPSARIAWWVTVVTFLAFTVAHIDRQLLSLLIRPIEKELHLSDAEFGALQGLAFAIFYTFVGIPIGYLADRVSRRGLIGICVFVWCAMTALTGYARNFQTLFFARVGVGAGEGGLSPAALSLISDLFPYNRLALPTGVFVLGNYFGSGLALILGGQLLKSAAYVRSLIPALTSGLSDWQLVFVAMGLPGLLLVPLSWSFKEPVRRFDSRGAGRLEQTQSIWHGANYLWANRRIYGPLVFGISTLAIAAIGTIAWMPALLMRAYSWDEAQAGSDVGWVYIAAGVIGTIVAGLADRKLHERNGKSPAVVISICCAIAIALVGIVFAIPGAPAWIVLLTFFCSTFFVAMPFALIPTALQLLSPNNVRGQVTALYVFVLSVIGIGFGPTLVGVLSDSFVQSRIFEGGAALGVALTLTGFIGCSLCVAFFGAAAREYQKRVFEIHIRESSR